MTSERESVSEKAARYLASGNLLITRLVGDQVTAECRSDSGQVYRLGHNPGDGWWCSCPAGRRCSHLTALQMVTVRRRAS